MHEAKLLNMWAQVQGRKASLEDNPKEKTISRDLIRSICEPFFEQMLAALEHALFQRQEERQQQCKQEAQLEQTLTNVTKLSSKAASFKPAFPSEVQQLISSTHKSVMQLKIAPTLNVDYLYKRDDEVSTEAGESGAFTSLLHGPSEAESMDADSKSSEVIGTAPAPLNLAFPNVAHQSGDVERNGIVCRHWKSKGWCRLQETGCCKFSHPDHKRGIPTQVSCDEAGADQGEVNRSIPLDAINFVAEVAACKGKRSRRSKKNRCKDHHNEQGEKEHSRKTL